MGLPRIQIATKTLQALIKLPPRQQSVLVELLKARNMHRRPPATSYVSYMEITDATEMKLRTARRTIQELKVSGWIREVSRRIEAGVTSFQYEIPRVQDDLETSFTIVNNVEENAGIEGVFEYEGKFWRKGGHVEFQSRSATSRIWADNPNPPEAVVEHFAQNG